MAGVEGSLVLLMADTGDEKDEEEEEGGRERETGEGGSTSQPVGTITLLHPPTPLLHPSNCCFIPGAAGQEASRKQISNFIVGTVVQIHTHTHTRTCVCVCVYFLLDRNLVVTPPEEEGGGGGAEEIRADEDVALPLW